MSRLLLLACALDEHPLAIPAKAALSVFMTIMGIIFLAVNHYYTQLYQERGWSPSEYGDIMWWIAIVSIIGGAFGLAMTYGDAHEE